MVNPRTVRSRARQRKVGRVGLKPVRVGRATRFVARGRRDHSTRIAEGVPTSQPHTNRRTPAWAGGKVDLLRLRQAGMASRNFCRFRTSTISASAAGLTASPFSSSTSSPPAIVALFIPLPKAPGAQFARDRGVRLRFLYHVTLKRSWSADDVIPRRRSRPGSRRAQSRRNGARARVRRLLQAPRRPDDVLRRTSSFEAPVRT
jgi:hypothetical protein